MSQAYLYLEPYDARVEVLFDVPSVLPWLNVKLNDAGTVSAQAQMAIRTAMTSLASEWCRMKADGEPVAGELTAVALVKGEPGNTLPLKPDEPVLATELMVGVVWEFPIGSAPAQVEVQWAGFQPSMDTLPLTVLFGNSTQALQMTRQMPAVTWNNEGRLPKPKPLVTVPPLPTAAVIDIPVLLILVGLLGAVLFVQVAVKRGRLAALAFLAVWAAGQWAGRNVGVWSLVSPFDRPGESVTTPTQAEAVLQPLLKNVYRAFDYRKEEDVYDRLARSIDGDLLRTLYLQTIKALTLEGQEGTRAKVNDLSVTVERVTKDVSGFVAEGQWTVLGTVGHWGHQHQRVNRYKATLLVVPVNNEWKIRTMNVLEERRL